MAARRSRGDGGLSWDESRHWLAFGLSGKDEDTITKCKILAETHVIPALGAWRSALASSSS